MILDRFHSLREAYEIVIAFFPAGDAPLFFASALPRIPLQS